MIDLSWVNKIIVLLIACCYLIFSTTVVTADNSVLFTMDMINAGFSEEQITRVREMIDTAKQKGLPADAVAEKLREGIAKHIKAERIIQALERVMSRYEYAYMLVNKLVTEKPSRVRLAKIVADGIAAGLTPRDAGKLIEALQIRSQELSRKQLNALAEETMRTVRDLSRQGISSRKTTKIVTQAVHNGIDVAGMSSLRHSLVNRGVSQNIQAVIGETRTLGRDSLKGHDTLSQRAKVENSPDSRTHGDTGAGNHGNESSGNGASEENDCGNSGNSGGHSDGGGSGNGGGNH